MAKNDEMEKLKMAIADAVGGGVVFAEEANGMTLESHDGENQEASWIEAGDIYYLNGVVKPWEIGSRGIYTPGELAQQAVSEEEQTKGAHCVNESFIDGYAMALAACGAIGAEEYRAYKWASGRVSRILRGEVEDYPQIDLQALAKEIPEDWFARAAKTRREFVSFINGQSESNKGVS